LWVLFVLGSVKTYVVLHFILRDDLPDVLKLSAEGPPTAWLQSACRCVVCYLLAACVLGHPPKAVRKTYVISCEDFKQTYTVRHKRVS
jgi:hypothetical protein